MTTRKSALRTVQPGEAAAAPVEPPTLDEAIKGGVYLEILKAQRLQITSALPGEKGPALAALHRQLSILSKEIAQLEAKARQEAGEDGDGTERDEDWDAAAL